MKRVVITGMGVVSPVGSKIDKFWDSLTHSVNGIGKITKFDTTNYKVKLAAEVKDFDPLDYYSGASEARKADRFIHYAVGAASDAFEDSGLKPEDYDPYRTGVYVGSGIGGMSTFIEQTHILDERGPSRVSPFFITMIIGNMATGAISIKLNAKGPTMPIVTACATSSNTIGEGFRTIKHGYADIIIAGGAENTINELAVAGFTNCKALTEADDPCRASVPFDAERSGFVMGEGAGIVILEEYEHALRRNAKIYAEVCGYGNTGDAYHITAPDPCGEGAARAIGQAIAEGGIGADCDPSRIYINAHGTSTPINDKTETLAIKNVFGENARKLHISSTKSMTGHMLGAAGAVEIIASTLALRDGIIPPTINYSVPDPDCDLDYTPNTAVRADITEALSTSLGFGGHNACVALRKI
jgi:3-oxoacyl-[acyl-carrier-protein] synthase II